MTKYIFYPIGFIQFRAVGLFIYIFKKSTPKIWSVF